MNFEKFWINSNLEKLHRNVNDREILEIPLEYFFFNFGKTSEQVFLGKLLRNYEEPFENLKKMTEKLWNKFGMILEKFYTKLKEILEKLWWKKF